MKTLKTLALILALAAPGAASAQLTTTKLTATKGNEYGLSYTLPVNGISVQIAARKTVRTPGPFANYAGKYLNETPIINKSVSWEIAGTAIEETATPDAEERYLVTLKGAGAPFISVTEKGGMLTGVNTRRLGRAAGAEATVLEAEEAAPTILDSPAARQAVTAEMIQSTSTAKRAELAAAKIYELRNSRNEIISGQADAMPSDGAAMQLALDRISEQEAALTAMFLGTEQVSVEVATYELDFPELVAEGESERVVVARLSQVDGLVDADDLSGAPVYCTFTLNTLAEIPLNEKGQPKTFPKGGVAYRIPGSASVALTYGGRTLEQATFDVAQYGVVFGLDPTLFTDKKAPSYLLLNPVTGGIVELGIVEGE
ncbi:MAG: DUF4831 family protein [Duncaniella sp.]|nr:DUF4831 family protein [Duncaniella sp.]